MTSPATDDRPSPFEWIHEDAQLRLFAAAMLVTIALSAWLTVLGNALTTAAAPEGIVTFELARTAAGANLILESWDARAREAAMLVQGIDFLFLVGYPLCFSLAALRLGRRLGGVWQRVGLPIAWAILLAAPLDVVENLALIRQIEFGASDTAAGIAWACAVPKFALVAVAALFVLASSAVALARNVAGRPETSA